MQRNLIKLFLVATLLAAPALGIDNVTVYPSADSSLLSQDFTMQVGGKSVPVYVERVAPQDKTARSSAMDNKAQTGQFFEEAAFAYFDMSGSAQVSVTYKSPVTTARILPAALGIRPAIHGKTVTFTLSQPQNLTLEVNNVLVRTLQIFANPPESEAPSPQDPKVFVFNPGQHEVSNWQMPAGKSVIYFAPGMHTIDNLTLRDGQTLYIAGGAVVRSVIRPGARSNVFQRPGGQAETHYPEPAIAVKGSNIRIEGRGVLDGSQTLGKMLMTIEGQHISMEGIVLQDSGTWNMPIQYSDYVTVNNVKILGYRANSDGIDVKSSRNVTIKGCYIRTLDDLIVIKTVLKNAKAPADTDTSDHILVQNNVLWNEVGHALSIGAEVQADVSNVEFMDNDIIHDLGRDWPMRIFLSGSGTVSITHFQNIRVDRTHNPYLTGGKSNLIYLSILNSSWRAGEDANRALGQIKTTIFRNIDAVLSQPGTPPLKARIDLVGASNASGVDGVLFDNITIDGKPMSAANTAITQRFATKVTGLPK